MKFLARLALCASLALCATSWSVPANAQGFALKSGDHVVVYGDSITAQRLYSNFAEAYVLTRFPQLDIDWTGAGWGGDTVGGGGGGPIDLRLQRDVIPYHPTTVTVMLGMNDGGYKPFDQPTFDRYAKGYQHIIDVIKQADPNAAFVLIQPSPYDDVTQPAKFPGGYNGVLIKYGQFVKSLAQKDGVQTVDFNTAVDNVLARALVEDNADAAKILPGRVHPSPAGHMIMAETLVKAWNFPATVAAVTLDGAAGTVTAAENTAVTNVVATPTLKWDELDKALPLPINLNDDVEQLALKCSDFVSSIDQEPLTVANLPAAKYNLNIDGKTVGTFTKEELAAGVNLATVDTPMLDQANTVLDLTNKHVGIHYQKFQGVQAVWGGDSNADVRNGAEMLAKGLDEEDQAIVVQQRAAAQPVLHHFELVAAQ